MFKDFSMIFDYVDFRFPSETINFRVRYELQMAFFASLINTIDTILQSICWLAIYSPTQDTSHCHVVYH